jgi:hypothetical protein
MSNYSTYDAEVEDTEPTGRLRALQELGAWPIHRDRLTAERVALMGTAWRAGNRNVAELARTADVSRDVVYTDLRALGIDPADPDQKKEPAVPATVLKAQTSRARLRAQMERLFADDRGLGVLVAYNGRPDMTEQAKRMQDAWAVALIAVHGSRTAGVYSEYAGRRQREVAKTAPPVGSWNNLVLEGKPLPTWNRDIHGFLCVNCGESFPSVLLDGLDPMCRTCARENTTPDQAVPLWKAYSHSRFVFPGVLREEIEELWGGHGETGLSVQYDDGEKRTYTGGDASFLFPATGGLPNLIRKSAEVDGESRDTIGCFIDAHTEFDNRGFDILARFTYDPRPEDSEPHPYGFRFEAARLTTTHTASPSTIEYTDLYELLDALITGLYSENEPQ